VIVSEEGDGVTEKVGTGFTVWVSTGDVLAINVASPLY
jgi:hypothetical protein